MLICAIPGCKAWEKVLRSGNLYLVDVIENDPKTQVPTNRKKFIWLCSSCAQTHTVQSWEAPGQQIRPKNTPGPIEAYLAMLSSIERTPGGQPS